MQYIQILHDRNIVNTTSNKLELNKQVKTCNLENKQNRNKIKTKLEQNYNKNHTPNYNEKSTIATVL